MTSATPPLADGDLLVEVRSYSRFIGGSGYRVFSDGRYETYASERPSDPDWEAGTPLSAEALAGVRQALAAIDPSTLKPRYESGAGPRDRGDTVWRVRVGDGLVRVEVVPGNAVPELEAVAAAVRASGEVSISMVWIVGPGDSAPRHPIRPDADPAPLDAVINALIGSGEACSATAPGSAASRVFAVTWKQPESADERQELWSDGLELWHFGDGGSSCKRHPASLVETVQGQLSAVDWATLSAR